MFYIPKTQLNRQGRKHFTGVIREVQVSYFAGWHRYEGECFLVLFYKGAPDLEITELGLGKIFKRYIT